MLLSAIQMAMNASAEQHHDHAARDAADDPVARHELRHLVDAGQELLAGVGVEKVDELRRVAEFVDEARLHLGLQRRVAVLRVRAEPRR